MKKIFKVMLVCITFVCIFGAFSCSDKNNEDVTIEKIIAANDRQKIVSEYGNLHISQDMEYDSGEKYAANVYVYSNDYGLIVDYLDEKVATDSDDFYATTLINGAMFTRYKSSAIEFFDLSFYNDDFYVSYINTLYNIVESEVIKGPEVENGQIIVKTESKIDGSLKYEEEKTFYINPETLLIEKCVAHEKVYSSKLSGETNAISSFEYGCSDFTPKMVGYNGYKSTEENYSFIVVRNLGTEAESRILYTVSSESDVYTVGSNALYFDKECTIEVDDYKNYYKEGYVPVFYLAPKA